MPNRRCQNCKRLHGVSPDDWKYLSPLQEDFVCSRECAMEFIKSSHLSSTAMLAAIPIERTRASESWSWMLDMYFRSNYERFVAESIVTDLGIKDLAYEEYGFVMGDGSQYVPDFLIRDHCFIEVKGRWGTGAKSKMKKFRTTYPDVTLLLLPWPLFRSFFPTDLELLRLA